MTDITSESLTDFTNKIRQRNPHEHEFIQAVNEVMQDVIPFLEKNPQMGDQGLLERLCEPERVIIFRVPWMDDNGGSQINRGYRVQMSSTLGPYKGGTRFHPSVNLSILKFLAFEQIFKNSLTGLPLGAGKGGSDFDPKHKSDLEIMRFCQSFMIELSKHIGKDTDIPAGDIGVNDREIGYMFGQYKRLSNSFNGVLTGKGLAYGGSLLRREATGYGNVFFAREMLRSRNEELEGKSCLVSGSGNVAFYTAEKLLELGAKVITLSDSDGTIHDIDGLDHGKLGFIKDLKFRRDGRIEEYVNEFNGEFYPDKKPWSIKGDLAFPCATQNELEEEDAKQLVDQGCILVCEGANMPCTRDAIAAFKKAKILFGPGKAANAGGVAVSGLEMAQNATGISWTKDKVQHQLEKIMKNIHDKCVEYGREEDYTDYSRGANIAGFQLVSNAMQSQGLV